MVTDQVIDSPSNPRIRSWRGLRSRRERDRTGTVLIEGRRETLRASDHLESVVVIRREDVLDLGYDDAVVVSERAFAALSIREHPDGVAGVFVIPDHDVATAPPGLDLFLIADGVEKPGNVGAMIRTADAFGAAFIGASLGTDLFNPNIVRAAQGSLFAGTTIADEREVVADWLDPDLQVVIAAPDGTTDLWGTDFTMPSAIVVGSEHSGVDPLWRAHGTPVAIPTVGAADSLNASVAAAVFVAEAARQRSA